VALRVVDPDIETPEYYNWFVGAQYQLPWRFMVEVNYNGTAGRKLMLADGPTSQDHNRFSGDLLDGSRQRLNPSFANVDLNESNAYSDYHGVSAQLQRRYANGFAFQAAYTYGVSKDVIGNLMDVRNLDLDYGYASNDVRHKLAMNFVAELPYRPEHPALRRGPHTRVQLGQPVPFTDVELGGTTSSGRRGSRQPPGPGASRSPSSSANETGRVECERTSSRAARCCAASRSRTRSPPGYPFDDTDVYKVIEGASYTLSVVPTRSSTPTSTASSRRSPRRRRRRLPLHDADDRSRRARTGGPARNAGCSRSDDSHELYNLGHLFEAAVAHHLATGKRTLLDVAVNGRPARETFGPGKRTIWPGHQITEMALVKLYR
jgi:hypothetical protein